MWMIVSNILLISDLIMLLIMLNATSQTNERTNESPGITREFVHHNRDGNKRISKIEIQLTAEELITG